MNALQRAWARAARVRPIRPAQPLCLLALLAIGACVGAARGRHAIAPELVHQPRVSNFDVEHYALEIDLDPLRQRIRGKARIRLQPRGSELLLVQLDFDDLRVSEVQGERGEALKFRHDDGVLAVRLARPCQPGDFVELSVFYEGAPRRGLYFSDIENGAATQVFTQGECEDSRGWFPCYDFPDDRATSEVLVRMPAHWTSVAAGERVERRELEDGRALERWRMTTPHPAYLTTLVAGDFVTESDEWDGIPLLYLADPKLAANMRARFAPTPSVLAFLSQLTGVRYPYPKYSQAVVANFQFGGMENISATTLTDSWLTDARGEPDQPADGLIAHEAAHQWFGDLLTCADWSHIWLNEGWATYATLLYMESKQGRQDFEIAMADTREGYLAQDVGAARRPTVHSTYRDPMDLFFSGHAYPGAASRLHQLRFELGDPAFFAGVKRYFNDHRGTAVTSADFQQSMQAASGRDLSAFFKQWFFQQGYPELHVTWDFDAGAGRVEVQVEQVHSFADLTPESFRMPAEIEIAGRDGSLRSERILLDERSQKFRFPASERPRWVLFDPHGWLVARVESVRPASEWVAIAQASEHALARRSSLAAIAQAARESSDERGRVLYAQVLEERLALDESPGVRAAAARALGGLAPNFGSVALQNAASRDASSSVRVAALVALGSFAPEPRLALFAREQYEAGFSWATLTAAAALEAQAQPQGAFERLCGLLGRPSPDDVHDASLVQALAGLADPRVSKELERLAFQPNSSARVREAAVNGLGRVLRADPEVRRKIEGLLADPDYRLRSAAISALGNLADPQSLPALEQAYSQAIDVRQRRALEALLRAPWAQRG